ncbi:two-component system chemotaxis response regulator CheB [Roseimicrobium gellanilyticum]|uniref:protein-glutamate methylesterase n=1 Tax=Roseimicrobium gellanilyticum TaxID=748857 RepID=A0A366HWU3_9BACT|nr:chemotaxis protein CheB [Roseimicrobium gellanilyticum]RBP47778.1 two-component system chemotaxis response regulator CheB [Roseimicrobium gellanilyticum]
MNAEPPPAAVVIGASVGAIEALSLLLPTLPAAYPLPVLVVVHVPPDRKSSLAELFATRCQIGVKEAEDKEAIGAGMVYFAPADYHLLVEPDFTISLSSDEPVLFSRPAIDVLFQSAADAYGDNLTGVVLTGASTDGALGLQAIGAAGGMTLVQTPDTAEGETMPRAALAACPTARALSLEEIATVLNTETLSMPR